MYFFELVIWGSCWGQGSRFRRSGLDSARRLSEVEHFAFAGESAPSRMLSEMAGGDELFVHEESGVHKGGFSKGSFSNNAMITTHELLNPPLLNHLCELPKEEEASEIPGAAPRRLAFLVIRRELTVIGEVMYYTILYYDIYYNIQYYSIIYYTIL